MTNWINKEKERIDLEREERPKYLRLGEGSTKVVVDMTKEPQEYNGQYGLRKILTIVDKEGERTKWGMSPVTFDKLIEKIYQAGKSEEETVEVEVIRVGVGKDTRWSFKVN